MHRRTCLKRLAFALPAALAGSTFNHARAAAPAAGELAAMETLAREFMAEFEVPGLSVAFSRRGKLVHRAAYGLADEGAGEALTPAHLFRIASVAKPITAVAVFRLIEQGKLKADDKVFGGLLDAGVDLPPRAADVTVHHLLTHTAGGWGNERDDPMFRHPALGHADLIARTLRERPLERDPGTAYAYSNFGYCLLGRILEKVGGKTYDRHVRDEIFEPAGITGMKLAGNTLADRLPGEVVYHGRDGGDPYGMNVRRMDAHGGWIARPEDVVKLLVRCDGTQETPDLLRRATAEDMFRPTAANPGYACGWAVNAAPHRWHSGSLPGTATVAVITAGGMCWAGFANARSPGISPALDRLMWDMAKSVPAWGA